MRSLRLFALLPAAALLASSLAWSAPKKKKEEVTQVLELPKDPPQAVVADASRLAFHVSPPSDKGLLSQQAKDALKSLFGQVKGAEIVKIRAFVAGSGDIRRVQAIVSETFTDKRRNLPALTVVQVGALPLPGAQVVMEAVSVQKKTVNPSGLAFVLGQRGPAKDAVANLGTALAGTGATLASLRQATCYLNSLESMNALRIAAASSFPKAPLTLVQIRRDSIGDSALCEGIAALDKVPDRSPSFAGESVALVGPVRLVLTGAQLAFGREESDVRLAVDRLGKVLEGVGANWKSVTTLDTYSLFSAMTERFSAVRKNVIGGEAVNTVLVFEGLPSVDALLGVDAVAVVAR